MTPTPLLNSTMKADRLDLAPAGARTATHSEVPEQLVDAAAPQAANAKGVAILLADQDGVIAVDARIAVAPVERPAATHSRFAIRPYPKQWERNTTAADGTHLFLRPIRPEDEELMRRFFSRVTTDDLRLRFFAPVKHIGHAFIARLTQLDYARAMAFVALDEPSGEMLGTVCLYADANHQNAEYAILVRSDLKGRGFGWLLMKTIIEYARTEGLRRVEGQVLRENTTMLTMCAELGFQTAQDADDPGILDVSLDLG